MANCGLAISKILIPGYGGSYHGLLPLLATSTIPHPSAIGIWQAGLLFAKRLEVPLLQSSCNFCSNSSSVSFASLAADIGLCCLKHFKVPFSVLRGSGIVYIQVQNSCNKFSNVWLLHLLFWIFDDGRLKLVAASMISCYNFRLNT